MGFLLPTENKTIQCFLKDDSIQEKIQKYCLGKRIKLKRSQIKLLFTWWMKSKETLQTLDQVIDDIIEKVTLKEHGTWIYIYRKAGKKWNGRK